MSVERCDIEYGLTHALWLDIYPVALSSWHVIDKHDEKANEKERRTLE